MGNLLTSGSSSSKAMRILSSKFDKAVETLEGMDPIVHSSSVAQYAEMIQKLADAIKAVKTIV